MLLAHLFSGRRWAARTHRCLQRSIAGSSKRTVELALELGQHQGDGLGGAGGGGHDVEGGCARTAQVAMAGVQQPLVAGVAVRGRHRALHDAELLMQHLHAGGTTSISGGAGHILEVRGDSIDAKEAKPDCDALDMGRPG